MHQALFDTSVYAVKAALTLIGILVMYRFLGKRDMAQFNVYDLVTIICLSNAAQNGMTGGRGELWIGIGCSTALLLVGFGIARLFVWKPASQRLLMGVPVLLISNGKVLPDRLKHEGISEEQLDGAIRSHGLALRDEVALAVLERDGSISIVPAGETEIADTKLF